MEKYAVFGLIMLSAGSLVYAQKPETAAALGPATNVEKFLLEKGRLITTEYHRAGLLKNFYGSVALDVVTLTDAQSHQKEFGLRIEVYRSGTIAEDHVSFLDPDEVGDLLKAVDYIAQVGAKWNDEWLAVKDQKDGDKKIEYRDASFTTKSELQVVGFRDGKKDGVIIRSGTIGRASLPIEFTDLKALRTYVDAASGTLTAAVR